MHSRLLAVSLEQASLDGGRMDIGYQLTWLEETFQGCTWDGWARGSCAQPFAPHLKELEVIQSKRQDNPRPKPFATGSESNAEPDPNAKPKRPPRKKKDQAASLGLLHPRLAAFARPLQRMLPLASTQKVSRLLLRLLQQDMLHLRLPPRFASVILLPLSLGGF